MDGDVDSIDGLQGRLHRREIRDVTLNNLAASLGQILDPRQVPRQTADCVSVCKQRLGDMPSEKARCSYNKNFFHGLWMVFGHDLSDNATLLARYDIEEIRSMFWRL